MPLSRLMRVLLLSGVAVVAGMAQQHQAPPPDNMQSGMDLSHTRTSNSMDPQLDRAQAYQHKLLMEDRRRRMLSDAERLAALSEQVRAAVKTMTDDSISSEVANKTAEMARLVRELNALNKE